MQCFFPSAEQKLRALAAGLVDLKNPVQNA
jgi:hypothetical protein